MQVIQISRWFRRPAAAVAAVLIAAAAIGGFLIMRPARAAESEKVDEARLVEVRPVEYGPVALSLSRGGFIAPGRRLSAHAMVAGQVIYSRAGLKSGTRVAAGEELLRIDDETIRNSMALARVELISATASLISALRSEGDGAVGRWQTFFGGLAVEGRAVPGLPETTSEREKLLAGNHGVLEAYYALREGEATLAYHRITAPFDGVIEGDGVDLGEYVTPGSRLFTLTDPVDLEISVPLTDSALEILDREGGPVRLLAADGAEGPVGEIVRIDGVMNRESQSLTVHIAFRNTTGDPRFLPGGYARVLLPGRTIPAGFEIDRGLVNSDGTVNLYRDGRLERFPAEVLARQGERAVLAPGLPEGSELITTTLEAAYPGMALRKAEVE